jgi:hypothetical protein
LLWLACEHSQTGPLCASSLCDMAERSELIVHYAELGHSVGEITLYLNRAHNIPIRQANTPYRFR